MAAPLPTLAAGALAAGEHAVVDPAEVFREEAWSHLVFSLLGGGQGAVVDYGPHRCYVWATRSGHGVYPFYRQGPGGRKEFCANVRADAGLLCIAPRGALRAGAWPEAVRYCLAAEAAPDMFRDGDVRHGGFEVITSGEVGPEYQTQTLDDGDLAYDEGWWAPGDAPAPDVPAPGGRGSPPTGA